MVDIIWSVIGLFVLDFIIALILRKLGLARAFEAVATVCFVIPVMYSLLDWNAGIQSGKYTTNDLGPRIYDLVIYGLTSAYGGGFIGYLVAGSGGNSNYQP